MLGFNMQVKWPTWRRVILAVVNVTVISALLAACTSSAEKEAQQQQKLKEARIAKMKVSMDHDVAKNYSWYDKNFKREKNNRMEAKDRVLWVQRLTNQGVIVNQVGETTDVYCPVPLLFKSRSMLLKSESKTTLILQDISSLLGSYHIEDLTVSFNQYGVDDLHPRPLSYQRAQVISDYLHRQGVDVRYSQATAGNFAMPLSPVMDLGIWPASESQQPNGEMLDEASYIHIHFLLKRESENRRYDG